MSSPSPRSEAHLQQQIEQDLRTLTNKHAAAVTEIQSLHGKTVRILVGPDKDCFGHVIGTCLGSAIVRLQVRPKEEIVVSPDMLEVMEHTQNFTTSTASDRRVQEAASRTGLVTWKTMHVRLSAETVVSRARDIVGEIVLGQSKRHVGVDELADMSMMTVPCIGEDGSSYLKINVPAQHDHWLVDVLLTLTGVCEVF